MIATIPADLSPTRNGGRSGSRVAPSLLGFPSPNTRKAIPPAALAAVVLLAAVFAPGLGPAAAWAGSPPSDARAPADTLHWNLAGVVEEALAASPGLQAMKQLRAMNDRRALAAQLTRLGRLSGVARAVRYKDDQILEPMTRQLLAGGMPNLPFDQDQFHYGLTYEIPLFLGGKLGASIRLAKLEAKRSEAQLIGTQWQVRFNATSLYASAQTLVAVERAVQGQIDALQATKKRLDIMVREGKRPDVDRLKVVEQLEGARARLESVRANETKVRAMLLGLMGKDPSQPARFDPLSPDEPRLTVDVAQLRDAVDHASPVRQAELRVAQAGAKKAIARSAFFPRLAARANIMEHASPSRVGPDETWEISLGVSMPLFEGGSRFAGMAAASHGKAAAERKLESVRLQAEAALEDAYAQFTAAQARLTAARARKQAGDEAARIEQIRYDTGAGTIEDLLRARDRAMLASASLAQAWGDLYTAAARINAVVEEEVVR